MVDTFLDMLIQMYGRTCRRYRAESVAYSEPVVMAFEYTGDYQYAKAVL